MKEKHGMRWTTLRGKRKVQMQAMLLFAAMNLKNSPHGDGETIAINIKTTSDHNVQKWFFYSLISLKKGDINRYTN